MQNQTEYDSNSITLPSTEGTSPVITNDISQANEDPISDTTHDTQTDMLAAPVYVQLQASTQPILVQAVNDEQAIPIQNQNLANIGMNIGMNIGQLIMGMSNQMNELINEYNNQMNDNTMTIKVGIDPQPQPSKGVFWRKYDPTEKINSC